MKFWQHIVDTNWFDPHSAGRINTVNPFVML